MKVLIADDHELISNGVVSYLRENSKEKFEFFTAKSKLDVIDCLNRNDISIVLQDIQFGDVDGRQLMKDALLSYPKLKFIVLSSHVDEFTVKSALSAGFNGYVSKNAPFG